MPPSPYTSNPYALLCIDETDEDETCTHDEKDVNNHDDEDTNNHDEKEVHNHDKVDDHDEKERPMLTLIAPMPSLIVPKYVVTKMRRDTMRGIFPAKIQLNVRIGKYMKGK